MSKILTKDLFLERANKIHNNKYDYSSITFIDSKTKVKIICNIHGDFYKEPSAHLQGYGCRECGLIKGHNSRKSNTKDFIEKAKKIHGNLYDFSLVNYVTAKTKVTVICFNKHNFYITPNNLLSGYGCTMCTSVQRNVSTEDFIFKAKKVHYDLYDYREVEYINKDTDVKIICNFEDHGYFMQTPHTHLSGGGCTKCAILRRSDLKRIDTKKFIDRSKKLFGDKFDYSLSNCRLVGDKVTLTCKEHNITFTQKAKFHLSGYTSCSKCLSRVCSESYVYSPNCGRDSFTTEEFINKAVKVHRKCI